MLNYLNSVTILYQTRIKIRYKRRFSSRISGPAYGTMRGDDGLAKCDRGIAPGTSRRTFSLSTPIEHNTVG